LQELQQIVVPMLKPYVDRIAVFGSLARGDGAETSDIDLLVDLKPADRRPHLGLKWFNMEQELSARLGREVELISHDCLSPYIRSRAEQEMIILYIVWEIIQDDLPALYTTVRNGLSEYDDQMSGQEM
jgi:predicted nucleotidyltransferase